MKISDVISQLREIETRLGSDTDVQIIEAKQSSGITWSFSHILIESEFYHGAVRVAIQPMGDGIEGG